MPGSKNKTGKNGVLYTLWRKVFESRAAYGAHKELKMHKSHFNTPYCIHMIKGKVCNNPEKKRVLCLWKKCTGYVAGGSRIQKQIKNPKIIRNKHQFYKDQIYKSITEK